MCDTLRGSPPFYILAFLCGVVISCSTGPYRAESDVLASYLDRKFGFEMPTEQSFLLLVREGGCSACTDVLLEEFDNLRPRMPQLRLLTDVSKPGSSGNVSRNDRHQIFFDDSRELARLDLGSGSTALFILDGGEIAQRIELSTDNISQLPALLGQ